MSMLLPQAALLLADVLFLRCEYDAATQHYEKLLALKPNNYTALAKLAGEATATLEYTM
jgi:hypothetical protein